MTRFEYSIFERLVLTLFTLILSSCATTELSNSWRNPSYTGPVLKKILVVGISKQIAVRRAFEDEFAKQLNASGVEATASYTLISESGEVEEARLTEAVRQSGADGMLVTRLVRIGADSQFTPAFRPTPDASFASGYSAAWTGNHEPSAPAEAVTVVLETSLYAKNESHLLWSGTTETFAPSGELQKDLQDIIKPIIRALKRQTLI